jgi:hypothetical protein
MRRDKSFADDLIVHRGAVSGRVALLLRSAEAKPYSDATDLFHLGTSHPSCRARANFEPCLRVVD